MFGNYHDLKTAQQVADEQTRELGTECIAIEDLDHPGTYTIAQSIGKYSAPIEAAPWTPEMAEPEPEPPTETYFDNARITTTGRVTTIEIDDELAMTVEVDGNEIHIADHDEMIHIERAAARQLAGVLLVITECR